MARAKKKATKKVTKKATKKVTKKTTAKKTAKKASPKKSMEMLLVASKTKEALKARGVNVSSDAMEGLNGWIHWLIEQGCNRAEANGRKTVRAHDFLAM